MHTLRVRDVLFTTPRSRGISLDLAGQGFAFGAGQAVMVGLHGSPLRKPYSIASAPSEAARTGLLQLLVQIDDTALDPHLERATPGTAFDVDGPFGTFGIPPESHASPLLLVAGGTGIAPLRSMLLERLAAGPAPRIAVVYSARSHREFAFESELEALERAGQITLHRTVTREADAGWSGRRGRISRPLIAAALPSTDACCLVCGPPALVSETADLLLRLGVPAGRILREKY